MKNLLRTPRVLFSVLFLFSILTPLKAAQTVTISVFSNFFQPASPTINVGDTVTWVFRASGHDTRSKTGLWSSGIKPINGTFSFTFTSAGSFPYVCTPHENIGMVGTITVQGAANTPPSVSLTSPGDGATFSTSDTITFSADASDPGGSVAKVEFFSDGNKIGEDTSAPYSITSTLGAGSHSITARATDNAGLTTTSSARTITVNAPANQPPSVSITSPANGATFLATDTITINANATDDGSIATVEFFSDGDLIGTDSTFRYSITANLPAGAHSLIARATDNNGLTTFSDAVGITVNSANQSPSVSISSPQAGTTISITGTVTLSATATDDGQIAQVEFFNGSNSIAVDTTAPYEATLSNVNSGTQIFYAVATDNSGATTTSDSIQVAVAAPAQITGISQNGGSWSIGAKATTGISYDLEASSDLINWTKVGSSIASGPPPAGPLSLVDNSSQTLRFYRVVAR
ncbi:MAG TPA: Ig-like domain-containing protein [Verrucomicrobiae bacterium]|nr:Ig-like domain-containing protein [Verrucomicrobiae bacterium]